ncbi:MAG TPA: hypothetical protein VMW12_02565 [Candidatus Dormibacteraeota bacterium]|nr:hypothetical protein [Candidatus Dormibacteraeota bacterium]
MKIENIRMKLSQEQHGRLVARLGEFNALGPCPGCGNEKRQAPPYLVRLIAQDAQSQMDFQVGLACATVGCGGCGLISLYDIKQIGVDLITE